MSKVEDIVARGVSMKRKSSKAKGRMADQDEIAAAEHDPQTERKIEPAVRRIIKRPLGFDPHVTKARRRKA